MTRKRIDHPRKRGSSQIPTDCVRGWLEIVEIDLHFIFVPRNIWTINWKLLESGRASILSVYTYRAIGKGKGKGKGKGGSREIRNADNRGSTIRRNSDHLSMFRQGVEASESRVAGGERSGHRAISGVTGKRDSVI